MSSVECAAKRALDVAASALGLLLLWPLIALCATIARRETGASGIYRQRRVGRHAREFDVLKIRTMLPGSDVRGSTVTVANDDRITRSGRVFRRFKLDELPQLWNVIKGEMSFVGPRPDVPGYADRLTGAQRALLELRPGITGPATIKYRDEEYLLAGQVDPVTFNERVLYPDKVRLNLDYLHNYRFLDDVRYILMTLGLARVPPPPRLRQGGALVNGPRVVLFYQHFWPDSPPYANMLRVIGGGLARAGFAVHMLTAQPSYKASDRQAAHAARETIDGIAVRRLAAIPGSARVTAIRLLGKVLFPPRALLSLLAMRLRGEVPDVVVAATIPPVLNGLCALAGARLTGARFVYHLQDIYPEIGAAGGLWPEESLRHRVLRALDGFVSRRADRCVVLSDDMRRALVERGVRTERVAVVNNFMLEAFEPIEGGVPDVSPTSADDEAPGRRRVVFAGNLGRFQALERLLEAFLAHARVSDGIELHFLGDGAIRERLETMANGADGVHFHGHVDFGVAARFIERCDAGIVSIGEGIHRYAYPSKTLTYLGLGVPVLVLVEDESSLALEVREHGLGVGIGDRSPEALTAGFAELESWLDEHPDASRTVLAHAARRASPAAAVERWRTLLGELVRNAPPGGRTTPDETGEAEASSDERSEASR